MFGTLAYLRLSKPVRLGGLQTVNLEIPLDNYPPLQLILLP